MVTKEEYQAKIAAISVDDFSDMTEAEFAEKLKSRFWRLNNLYWIKPEEGGKVKFRMNYIQYIFYYAMWFFNIILKSRQHGFTTLICIFMLDACLFNSNVAAGVIAHRDEDVKVIFRKKIKFPYDSLPKSLKERLDTVKDDQHEIEFANGSSIRVGLSMRSDTLNYLLISEFGKICSKFPQRAEEIVTGTLPTVHEGNLLFVESTAEGRNNTYHRWCKDAQLLKASGKDLSKLEMKFFFFTWYERAGNRTDPELVTIAPKYIEYFDKIERIQKVTLDPAQRAWYVVTHKKLGQKMLRENPSTVEESFRGAVEGAFYSEEMGAARTSDRVIPLEYDPQVPVYTVWDLGVSASMAIWFIQPVAPGFLKWLDYFEDNRHGYAHYAKVLQNKPYVYGSHFAPHDIKVQEHSGLTRQEQAAKVGIYFQVTPDIGLANGRDLLAQVIPVSYFNSASEDCMKGVDCIEGHRREWNDKLGCFNDNALGDWTNHGADAARYVAVNFRAGYITGKFPEPEEENKRRKDTKFLM